MIRYNDAVSLMESGQYAEAAKAFDAIDDYKDAAAKGQECAYQAADSLMNDGEYTEAAIAFGKLGNYKDGIERSFALWEIIAQRDTISAGKNHTVGLRSDCTVVATGWNHVGQCDVSDWTDIKLPYGGNHCAW